MTDSIKFLWYLYGKKGRIMRNSRFRTLSAMTDIAIISLAIQAALLAYLKCQGFSRLCSCKFEVSICHHKKKITSILPSKSSISKPSLLTITARMSKGPLLCCKSAFSFDICKEQLIGIVTETVVLMLKYDTSYPNNTSNHKFLNFGQYSPQQCHLFDWLRQSVFLIFLTKAYQWQRTC